MSCDDTQINFSRRRERFALNARSPQPRPTSGSVQTQTETVFRKPLFNSGGGKPPNDGGSGYFAWVPIFSVGGFALWQSVLEWGWVLVLLFVIFVVVCFCLGLYLAFVTSRLPLKAKWTQLEKFSKASRPIPLLVPAVLWFTNTFTEELISSIYSERIFWCYIASLLALLYQGLFAIGKPRKIDVGVNSYAPAVRYCLAIIAGLIVLINSAIFLTLLPKSFQYAPKNAYCVFWPFEGCRDEMPRRLEAPMFSKHEHEREHEHEHEDYSDLSFSDFPLSEGIVIFGSRGSDEVPRAVRILRSEGYPASMRLLDRADREMVIVSVMGKMLYFTESELTSGKAIAAVKRYFPQSYVPAE